MYIYAYIFIYTYTFCLSFCHSKLVFQAKEKSGHFSRHEAWIDEHFPKRATSFSHRYTTFYLKRYKHYNIIFHSSNHVPNIFPKISQDAFLIEIVSKSFGMYRFDVNMT